MKEQPTDPREPLWRRKLSAPERAALRAQPELELEARLTDALAKMPDAPVASNFTARVLEAVELEELQAARSGWRWDWRLLLPRVAVAAAILVFTGIGLQRHEVYARRAELAKNLATVASTPAPSLDALENLDAIQRMSQPVHADGELLAALQ